MKISASTFLALCFPLLALASELPASLDEIPFQNEGEKLTLSLPGLTKARLRWWDGEKFQDSGVTISLSSVTGKVALPKDPILGKWVGALTLIVNGEITRYSTSTRARLCGVQEDREPPLMVIWMEKGYLSSDPILIVDKPDPDTRTPLVFERATTLGEWQVIPSTEIFPVFGLKWGYTFSPTAPSELYRVSYAQ